MRVRHDFTFAREGVGHVNGEICTGANVTNLLYIYEQLNSMYRTKMEIHHFMFVLGREFILEYMDM